MKNFASITAKNAHSGVLYTAVLGKDVRELSSLNILGLGKKVFGKDFFL